MREITDEVKKVIIGKDEVVDMVFAAILAQGHVLMEDVPGVGKTTLAVAFSKALGLETKRIQFTPDTVASDITGYTAFDRQAQGFTFHSGAAMTNILLADEINRTSTQNPTGTVGTAALPVSQLDRFMIKLSMGYPDKAAMRSIMSDRSSSDPLADVKAVCTAEKLIEMQEKAKAVFVDDSVYDYISDLCDATRHNENISLGVSPRGALALCRIAKAWACYKGREYVVPQDVRDFFVHVCSHRISLSAKGRLSGLAAESVLDEILGSVKCPENEEKRR